MQNCFPIFIKSTRKKALVIGGDLLAESKVALLVRFKIPVRLIAANITLGLSKLIQDSEAIEYQQEDFTIEKADQYCKEIQIIISADPAVNEEVYTMAKQAGILINVVDNMELSDFIVPAIIDRSPILVAVSTSGTAPHLASKIRSQIEAVLPKYLGKLAIFCNEWRSFIKESISNFSLRQQCWEEIVDGDIAEYVYRGEIQVAQQKLKKIVALVNEKRPFGEVYIVGAGPGNPDLLTLEALRLIKKAEVIIYDRLVSPEILDKARRDAEKVYVGKSPGNHCLPQKEINDLVVQFAKQGKRVVRLKGGDPLMFAQCGDEIAALKNADIPFYITPGITAAFACAAFAKIPLTHRDFASQCVLVTGHKQSEEPIWETLFNPPQTIVIYMGVANLSRIVDKLITNGLARDIPAAIIENVGSNKQRYFTSTLINLPQVLKDNKVESPAIVIVGHVVKFTSTASTA